MESSRRRWLKQFGISMAGIGIANFRSFPSPTQFILEKPVENNVPIKLSSNENPYGPSPKAKTAFLGNINISNRYNWELTSDLIAAIALKNNIAIDNVLIGAGSTELIDLVARHSALKKGSLVIADPSYAYWTSAAQKLGLTKITVPLTAAKKLDLPAMLKAIQSDTRLIYVCNPNNPTGTICEREALVNFINLASKKAIVLIDEAYIEFTDQQSVSNLVVENENVVITKTFSKIYGLAGARVGYAIANNKTIDKLSELQSWINGSVSVASTAAALASLKDDIFITESYTLNEKAKQYTMKQLEQLELSCIPSCSNFLYFSLTNYKKDYFQQLKDNNILGTRIYEEQGKWTRITVGTIGEMEKFISAIK